MAVCPRCGGTNYGPRRVSPQTSRREGGPDMACFSGNCAYPRPEPGPINLLRLRHGPAANDILQAMRVQGTWPPPP